MEAVIDLIASFGFPIALTIALILFIYRIYLRSEKREDDLKEQLKQSQDVNAKAIETLAKYSGRLDSIEDEVKDIKNILTER